MGRARIAEKSDDLACIVDAESLSALGQGSIQRGEAAAAEDETVKDAVGPESSDDLARAVDAKWVGVLGGQGIVDRGEDIDWHVVALLIADGCHQHYQLAIRGRRRRCDDLDASETNQIFLDDLDAFQGAPSLLPALGFFHAVCATHRSGTHDVLVPASNLEVGDAAYRRTARTVTIAIAAHARRSLLRPALLLASHLVLQRKRADCGTASPVIAALCGQNAKRQCEHERGGGDDYAFGHHGSPLGF